MGSTLILKIRLNLKPSALLDLPHAARFLCTRDLGGRDTDRTNRRAADKQGRPQSNALPKLKNVKQRVQGHLWDSEKREAVRQGPLFPQSVFAAGTAKKTADMMKRKAGVFSEDDDGQEPVRRTEGKLQTPDKPLSADEWKTLKESLGSPQRFDIQMMSSLFNRAAQLDIAKSLLTFVATETGTLPYELLLRYLTLCVSGGHDTEALDVYEIMLGSFPSLDTGAATLFIKSFSRTERWREAIGILNDLKKVITPSPRNYSDIIAAAMQNGDPTTAWALYDEALQEGLRLTQEMWDSLFKKPSISAEEAEAGFATEHQERLQGILHYMRDNQEYPQKSLSSSIKTWFESRPAPKWTGNWTQVSPKGVCKCCGTELESIQLTAEEYQQLRDRVMADIIQGRDVFNKTTPEELENFKSFVRRKPAFDVVVDGLNVAGINKDRGKQSETLLAVVSELAQQGLTVLVLGRKHMLRPSRFWKGHHMNLIQKRAHCFFTENISEDDPFLLYATLHSGNHCRFVSRDLMRDHKACLSDGASRRLFFKWQRGHQMVVKGQVVAGKRVQFQAIPSYDTIIQTSGDSWHVPYDDTEDRATYEVPQRWLCLNKKH